MPHVIVLHLIAQHAFSNGSLLQALPQQPEEKRLLIRIRMTAVLAQESILAEELSARPHQPGEGREQTEFLGRAPIHRQPGFPGLRPALGVVEHLGVGGQLIKVTWKRGSECLCADPRIGNGLAMVGWTARNL